MHFIFDLLFVDGIKRLKISHDNGKSIRIKFNLFAVNIRISDCRSYETDIVLCVCVFIACWKTNWFIV